MRVHSTEVHVKFCQAGSQVGIETYDKQLELLKAQWAFSSCQAAHTVVTKGYKSLYHEAGIPFYGEKKNAASGTAVVVLLL